MSPSDGDASDPKSPYEIGARGEKYLIDYLRARGHTVEALGHGATFDLQVDGTLAEVKASRSQAQIVGLTEAQIRVLEEGTEARIYLVSHLLKAPDGVGVEVIDAQELLRETEPNVYRTFEWRRTQLAPLARPLEADD